MTTVIDLPQAVVPGLNAFLGLARSKATETAEETLEALCARLSRPERGPFRIRCDADGTVTEAT